jgi:hypothetical protein
VERAEKAAAAVLRGEKEKQASAGSVIPPPTRSLLAQFGTKHRRSPGRNRAVAPPLTDKQEALAELAAREQTIVAAHQTRATPLTTLSPPPPRPLQRFPRRCLRVQILELTRKTRRAGFGPADRRASYYWGDTCHLYPYSQPRQKSAVKLS